MPERLAAARTFRDLLVWRKAHEFVLAVYRVTKKLPAEERFELSAQLRKAAVSVPANIADEFVKRGKADKIRFFNIAEGSLEESRYYLILANDLGYADTGPLQAQADELSRFLRAYITKIRESIER